MDRTKLVTRGMSLAVCATLVIGALVVSAHADNAISRALHQRKVTVQKLEILHDFRRVGRQNLHHQIRNIQARIEKVKGHGPALASDRQRFNRNAHHLAKLRRSLRQRLHKLEHNVRHRTLVLRSQRMDLSTWIQTYGIFRYCPVRGPVDVTNNFGYAIPHRPGVPAHIHQGDDMMAGSGQPIVAPFDGIAEASHNWLGGNAVYVRGRERLRLQRAPVRLRQARTGEGRRRDRLRRIDRRRRRPARPLRVAPGQRQRGGPVPVPDGGLLVRLIGHRQGIIDRSH